MENMEDKTESGLQKKGLEKTQGSWRYFFKDYCIIYMHLSAHWPVKTINLFCNCRTKVQLMIKTN